MSDTTEESRSDRLQDLLIGHQIGLLRLADGTTRAVVTRMNQQEDEFLSKVLVALGVIGAINASNYIQQQPKIEKALKEISLERSQSWQEAKNLITKEMIALALWEATWQQNAVRTVLTESPATLAPFQTLPFTELSARTLTRRVPIQGQPLGEWIKVLEANDIAQVQQTIRLGLQESSPVAEIVDSIRGTAASQFSDGISERLRKKVDAVIKTATVEVSQAVREKVWQKNRKRISGLVWSAILDSRTSSICRGLDGRVAPLFGEEDTLPPGLPRLEPPDKRPPAHFRCRSIVAAIVDDTLPRETSYGDWLLRQSSEVQKDVLGPLRFNMLKSGKLDFNSLFDGPTGKPLTLAELKERENFQE